MMVNETAGKLNPRLQSEHVSVTWLLLLQPVGGIGWCCQIDLILSNSVPIYTVFKKNFTLFTFTSTSSDVGRFS